MKHLQNRLLNLNFLNDKIENSYMAETNINNDFEDSNKSLSLEENPTCIPHLFEKFNCLKSEISDKNKEIVDDKNIIVNNEGISSKKIEDESFDEKIIFIEKKINVEEKEKEKTMIIIMMSMTNFLMIM